MGYFICLTIGVHASDGGLLRYSHCSLMKLRKQFREGFARKKELTVRKSLKVATSLPNSPAWVEAFLIKGRGNKLKCPVTFRW